MNDLLTRRRLLLAAAAAGTACLSACASRPSTTDMPPTNVTFDGRSSTTPSASSS